jgi:hypothetical protein
MISEPVFERGCQAEEFHADASTATNEYRMKPVRDQLVEKSRSTTLKATAQSNCFTHIFSGHVTESRARVLVQENAVRQTGQACRPPALPLARAKPWIVRN